MDCQGNLGLSVEMPRLPCAEEASWRLCLASVTIIGMLTVPARKMAEAKEGLRRFPRYPSTQPSRASLGTVVCLSFFACEARLSNLHLRRL